MNDELKGLPSNPDTERLVLGSVLLRGLDCFREIADMLRRGDFALDKHQRIYASMERLAEKEQAIDHVTVANDLLQSGELEAVDGLSYLVSLDDGMPVIASLDAYVHIIREKAARRRIAVVCQQGLNRALEDQEESADIAASLVANVQAIETEGGDPEWKRAGEILREFPGGWQALVSPGARENRIGIPLPWPMLQQVVCGLQAGELVILAARPGMGKSAMAMQIAMHAAGQNCGVAYVSLEMTGAALVRREVAQEGRLDFGKMRLGYLGAQDRARLVEARTEVERLPIHIESRQSRGRTAAAVLASLRYLKVRSPIGLVVIDHFHLIDGPEREERVKYNRIADALQRGAREMEIPFLVLAQLNRRCEEERREPGLPDLKECGKIEENADLVMMIHRPEMYAHNRDREDLRGLADLIIAKQRDGASGKAKLVFRREQMRFESLAEDIQ